MRYALGPPFDLASGQDALCPMPYQIDVRLIGTASGDILATAKLVGEADQSDSNFSVRGIGGNSGSSNEDGLLSAAVDKAVSQMVTKLAEVFKKLP